MSLSEAEDLSADFDAWMRLGCGYQVWETPVELEPPYRQPAVLQPRAPTPVVDDGRKPSLWQRLLGESAAPQRRKLAQTPVAEVEPFPYTRGDDLVEIQVVLPEGLLVRQALAEEFLSNLHNIAAPISFEIIGFAEGIVLQICCSQLDHPAIRRCLRSFFPEVRLREEPLFLVGQWYTHGQETAVVDFGLAEVFLRCLNPAFRPEVDPLMAVVGAMEEMDDDELAIVQMLFRPAQAPWMADALDVLEVAQESARALPIARQKASKPLHAAVIRVAALAADKARAFDRARGIGSALIASTRSEINDLLALDNDGYADEQHVRDILRRETHRSGMLLNLSELLTLVHLPSASVRSDGLIREDGHTKAAPDLALGHDLVLGINEHEGEQRVVGLSVDQRMRHTYVVGASGTGKSTLLLSMAAQLMEKGGGLAVLDPHGDLIDDLLARVPASRLQDVILLNPADEDFPVGFNILSAHSELEKTLLASDLVAVFRRLSTSWGDQMTSVLGNAILAFLESSKGGTLVDMRRFLVDAHFRTDFLKTVADPEVVYYWQREFPLLSGRPQAPLLTRLDTFLRPKLVRFMVGQKENKLDFGRIMDGRKIFLAKLAQGAIGEENAYLLGTLLVSKFHQLTMGRQERAAVERQPFHLFIDEFHHFVTPSMASLLSGARKYRLGLVLAHQDLRQLQSRDGDVASAVLANAYTRIVFRVGDADAGRLADGFSFFDAKALQNLGTGQAVARLERAEFDFNLETIPLDAIDRADAQRRGDRAADLSRQTYGTPREVVIQSIGDAYSPPQAAPQREPAKSRERPKAQAPADPPAPNVASTHHSPSEEEPKTPPHQSPVEETPNKPPGAARSGASQRDPERLGGRGGPQHKYLQSLLRRMGEDRGYRATIEKRVLDGAGHIDVLLERDGTSIACEISVTTNAAHEIANLQKCIAAGFDFVVLVASDKATLREAREALQSIISDREFTRTRFLSPQAFAGFLEEVEAKRAASASTVKGYKVKTTFRPLSDAERKEKEALLNNVISKSLGRMRKRKKKS